jgi:hypothetical protein
MKAHPQTQGVRKFESRPRAPSGRFWEAHSNSTGGGTRQKSVLLDWPPYALGMTSDGKTPDEPIADGTAEAAGQEKFQRGHGQVDADVIRDAAIEDSLRSVRAVGEKGSGRSADGE